MEDARSCPWSFEDLISKLKNLEQTGSIKDYHTFFLYILRSVDLPDEVVLSWFIAGLRMETKREVWLFRPHTLIQAYAYGRLYEMAYPKKCFVAADSQVPELSSKQSTILLTPTSTIGEPSKIDAPMDIEEPPEKADVTSPEKAKVPSPEPLLLTQVLFDAEPSLQELSLEEEASDEGENSTLNTQGFVVDVAMKSYQPANSEMLIERSFMSFGVNEISVMKAQTDDARKVFVKMSEPTVKLKSTRSYQDAFKLSKEISDIFLGFRMMRCAILGVAKAEVDMNYGSTCLMFDPGGKPEKRGFGIYLIWFETFAWVVFDPGGLLLNGMTLLLVKVIYEAVFNGVHFVFDPGGALETRDRLWEFEWKEMECQGNVKLGLLRHGITWDARVFVCDFCLQLKLISRTGAQSGGEIQSGSAGLVFTIVQWDPGVSFLIWVTSFFDKEMIEAEIDRLLLGFRSMVYSEILRMTDVQLTMASMHSDIYYEEMFEWGGRVNKLLPWTESMCTTYMLHEGLLFLCHLTSYEG